MNGACPLQPVQPLHKVSPLVFDTLGYGPVIPVAVTGSSCHEVATAAASLFSQDKYSDVEMFSEPLQMETAHAKAVDDASDGVLTSRDQVM